MKSFLSGTVSAELCLILSLAAFPVLSGISFGVHIWRHLVFISILLFISIRDIQYRTISNRCILSGILLFVFGTLMERNGSLYHLISFMIRRSFAAFLIAGSIFLLSLFVQRSMITRGLGSGDIKLIFVVCLYLDFVNSLYMLLIACFNSLFLLLACGFINGSSVYNRQWNRLLAEKGFPMGPAIAAACIFILSFISQLSSLYVKT